MTTKQLYLVDSYLKEFEGTVQQVVENRVILDQTAFYPFSGGVVGDTGHLRWKGRTHQVIQVELDKDTKEIIHILAEKAEFYAGAVIEGVVDWERRYRLMRLHTAAHLIAAIMYRDYNALITGGQVDVKHAKLDFNLPKPSRELFEEAINKASREANRNVTLKTYFVTRKKALEMPGIVKLAKRMPPKVKELRIVEIPHIDTQADGGPHVKNTREINDILLLKVENKGKEKRRVYFDVG